MKTANLNEKIIKEISILAENHKLKKVILFGSRARGDNRERSNIDLAVSGGNTTGFAVDTEDINTLLMIDVVNLDGVVHKELFDEIEKDGIVIYEKI